MAMDARIAMPTSADILTLSQWFSPAYPIGAFSYSHGLEWAVEAGDIKDASALEDWIRDVLRFGAGRNDALFLAASYLAQSPSELMQIGTACRAFASSSERLCETDQQGAAFCKITADVWGEDLTDLAYPVAVGHAAQLSELPLTLTSSLYLQAFASNLIGAAQRLIRLGQSDAQQMIKSLAPLSLEIAQETQTGDLAALSGTAFLSDISAMKHETQYSRMFQT